MFIFRPLNKKFFFYQNVVRADIFSVLWQFLKNAASPTSGESQNHGGFSSPPQAAKNVRTNLRIVHFREKVNFLFAASLRSAAKLNGELSEKINFWFCIVKENFNQNI